MSKVKAVFHAHSTWSYDGSWSLAEIARFFGRLGADAVFMTEHDTGFDPARWPDYVAQCAAASQGRCVLVPGIEYSSPDNDIHILTWGVSHFLAEHRPVLETLKAVAEQNGVAVFAHPIRRKAFAQFQMDWVPYLAGIELWNRKSDGIFYGQEASELIKKTELPATVGCDFHTLRNYYPLANRFECSSRAEIAQAGIDALKEGRIVPTVMGRPLMDAQNMPNAPLHARLEVLRKRVLRK